MPVVTITIDSHSPSQFAVKKLTTMAKNSPSLTIVKAHLKNCSKEELIADITELFKRFQPVQDY